jgi:hypothetical protein
MVRAPADHLGVNWTPASLIQHRTMSTVVLLHPEDASDGCRSLYFAAVLPHCDYQRRVYGGPACGPRQRRADGVSGCRTCTGVTARAWDVAGRVGAVDAFLDYPDGRSAAFKVTRAASDPRAWQLDRLLGRDGFAWPLPGRWWWTVTISDVRDLPRLRQCFANIVLFCEAEGVHRPKRQWRFKADQLDDDLRWLITDSSVDIWGYPDVPAAKGEKRRKAMVTPPGGGGVIDDSLSGLNEALQSAFAADHLQRRVAKLLRTPAHERHLFVIVHETDLQPEVTLALMFGNDVPSGEAWLPQGIGHLWLAPAFSDRVVLGSASGWVQHLPYDDGV